MSQGFTQNSGIALPLSLSEGGTGNNTGSLTSMNGTQNGTTTNDDAAAGKVGEFLIANLAFASPMSITSSTTTNVLSLSLTAGDWDVTGIISFKPGAGTTSNYTQAWCSVTSATKPDPSIICGTSNYTGTSIINYVVPTLRVSIASTTTVYLTVEAQSSVAPFAACGQIRARRIR